MALFSDRDGDLADVGAGAETWRERRLPRSGFGNLVKWVFVAFHLWVAFEVVRVLVVAGQFRDANRGNGFALLGGGAVFDRALTEWFVLWAVVGGVLGVAVLATRGRREMVRVTAPRD